MEQALPTPVHLYRCPRISPDGNRLALSIEELGGQVWIYDFAAETLTRLTAKDISSNLYPAWTPDGKHIAFRVREPPQETYIGKPLIAQAQPNGCSQASTRKVSGRPTHLFEERCLW